MRSYAKSVMSLAITVCVGCESTGGQSVPTKSRTRTLLIGGTWARHLDEKLFFADGTYESHDISDDKPKHGTWRLDGRILTMTEGGKTARHQIISLTAKDLDMTFGDGSEGLHYRRWTE